MKFPRWLSWMFVAVLGYMVFAASQMSHAPAPSRNTPLPVITEETYPALAEATDVERWKRALNPDYAATTNCTVDRPPSKQAAPMMVMEETPGEGAPAACGESLTLELTVWDAKGVQQFNGKVTLALGSRELASGLDKGLLGLKPGGVRVLVLPAYARVHTKSKPADAVIIDLRKMLQGESVVMIRAKRV